MLLIFGGKRSVADPFFLKNIEYKFEYASFTEFSIDIFSFSLVWLLKSFNWSIKVNIWYCCSIDDGGSELYLESHK